MVLHVGEYDQTEIDQYTEQHRDLIAMQEMMIFQNTDGKYSFWSKSNDGWINTGYFLRGTA
ncbi:hypothetical protein [Oceanobacillus kapialis]